MNTEQNEKVSAKLVLSRIGWFVISGFAILAIYLVVMAPLAPVLAANIDPTDTEARSARFTLIYLSFAGLYIIPLYLFLFRNNIGLKTEVLHVTENGFDLKTVFRAVYRRIGLLDHMIYAGMTFVVWAGRALGSSFIGFLMVQQAGFYSIPIPEIIGALLATLCFAAEYALCLVTAGKRWDKNRLRRGGSGNN